MEPRSYLKPDWTEEDLAWGRYVLLADAMPSPEPEDMPFWYACGYRPEPYVPEPTPPLFVRLGDHIVATILGVAGAIAWLWMVASGRD